MSRLLSRQPLPLISSQPLPLIYSSIQSSVNQFTNVLLVDNSVPDYQIFVDSANSSTFPIVYSTTSSKTELLALLQKMFTSISRIGIVFTSSLENSKPFLDKKLLFKENEVEPYSENAQFIIDIIKEFSVTNIDYLACNTLNFPNWTNYYQLLTQNTGVVVGASDDKTGNIKFGGDWLMESTGQDIELIYFTQSIEYYTYLLDNLDWVSSALLVAPTNLTIDSNNINMYVTNYSSSSNDTISKIVIATQEVTTFLSFQNPNSPFAIAIDSNNINMYVTNPDSSKISKIVIATQNVTPFVSGIDAFGIAIDSTNTYLYVAESGGIISKIDIATQDVTPVVSGLSTPYAITIDSTNTYLYVTGFDNGTISKIDIAAQNATTFVSGLEVLLLGITIDSTNTYLYVTNYDENDNATILQIDIATKDVTPFVSSGLISPVGLTIDPTNTYLYCANYNADGIGTISQISLPAPPYPCFNKDTKILTDKGYKLIQDLRKGDFVKTTLHDFKPIVMIGFRDIHHLASKERIKDQLYKCSQTEYPEVFEPLILTGCHSILVDDFTSNEQRDKVIEINGNTYVTDNKYRLPACADERAHVYEIPGNYTIYHVALENDDYYMNYGIFANGLLVESCSKRYLKELSNMQLIE
jgi:DNA-binding beta-propeller fold protein YncE